MFANCKKNIKILQKYIYYLFTIIVTLKMFFFYYYYLIFLFCGFILFYFFFFKFIFHLVSHLSASMANLLFWLKLDETSIFFFCCFLVFLFLFFLLFLLIPFHPFRDSRFLLLSDRENRFPKCYNELLLCLFNIILLSWRPDVERRMVEKIFGLNIFFLSI